MNKNISLELKKILPELEGLRLKTQGKLTKDEEQALEKPTENILIKPFLNIFGYTTESITAPNRAESEYKIGTKRVDFALFKDNKLVIVIEAKRLGTEIHKHFQQLSDYFNTTDKFNVPLFGILTNGEDYEIYSSSENRMDKMPCFTFNLVKDIDNEEKLGKLSEILFNINEDVAKKEMLYTQTRIFIETIFKNPKDDLVRYLIKFANELYEIKLYDGKMIQSKDIDNISNLISKIYNDIIIEQINLRLDSAKQMYITDGESTNIKKDDLEFNNLEQMGLLITKGIAAEIENFDISRIMYQDYKAHCDIILDNKKNKICRLYFNNIKKLSIDINGESIFISDINDIYKYKEEIKKIIKSFLA